MSRRRRGPALQEDVSPNLIPMVDIMFLLLLFFMLGADMGQRELEEVMLPKAVSIKEDKETKSKTGDRLTVNVYHRYSNEVKCDTFAKGQVCRDPKHWRVGVKGHDYTGGDKLGGKLMAEVKEAKTDPKDPKVSELKVMIRADASAPYGMVQDVMNTCVKVGIYKIECGAARPTVDRPKSGA